MLTIDQAIHFLNQHQVVAIPTETVYGLAARVDSLQGLKQIFAVKERPFFDPLILHAANIEMAKKYTVKWPQIADVLAKSFMPGPITFVLPKNSLVDKIITAGLDTVAIRCPNHPLTIELINKIGVPLAAPSANKFKSTSPTQLSHVREELGDIPILDGGETPVGIESTVCGFVQTRGVWSIEIYRPGSITKDQLIEVLKAQGLQVEISYKTSPVAPGQLEHHYMPKIPLIVLENTLYQEALLRAAMNSLNITKADIFELSLPPTPELAARVLYHELRQASKTQARAILIRLSRYHQEEKWQGVVNRIYKARSYPR